MAITAPPTITALPTPPDPNDRSTFNARAYPWSVAQQTFGTQVAAVAANVRNNALEAQAEAEAAAAQVGLAAAQVALATTQATTATTKAAEALASAASAAGSKADAEALIESYQGARATDPTVDKNGNPLAAGDWYINTATGFVRAYNGSAWVQGISVVAGVSSLNGLTGALTGFVTETGTQTLTNKTLTSPAITGGTASGLTLNDGYTEEIFAVTGTTPALSPTNGSIQTWTLSGASTPTQGTWANGQSITLLIDDGTANTIDWSSLGVVWKTNGGNAPTLLTTGLTVIQLWEVGDVIYGARVGDA